MEIFNFLKLFSTTMEFKELKKIKLNSPIMLAGAPGMGLVAKHTIDYFIKKLRPKELGAISADYDYYSIAIFDDHGVLIPRAFHEPYRFYFLKTNKENDIVLFSADFQPTLPEAQNKLSDKVAQIAQSLKVKRIYTTAAMPVRDKVKVPKVFGVATSLELMELLTSNGIEPLRGQVSGFNGVLLEYARKRGIEGICLLSETYIYYIENPLDPVDLRAVLAVVKKTAELLDLEIDTKELENKIARCEEMYQRLEEEYQKVVKPPKAEKEVPSYIG
jgi:predicted ATP-grasp superfamily ATP-dependent carboligase